MTNPQLNPPLALLAVPAGGDLTRRAHPDPPHPYRSPFARDAARVLHARAFRRLAGKTQVFARLAADSPSDHFRSRLTHTLEVAQIARTAARALGLNGELAEALGLSRYETDAVLRRHRVTEDLLASEELDEQLAGLRKRLGP